MANAHESKSQAAANRISEQRSSSESRFLFIDNRPEAIVQRKLQEMINNRPRVRQLKAFHDKVRRGTIQFNDLTPTQRNPETSSNTEILGLPRDEFFKELKTQLEETGDAIFEGSPLQTKNCPWINKWFEIYKDKSPGEIEQSIMRYLSIDQITVNAGLLIKMICDKATYGFRSQLETGNPSHLPEEVSTETGGQAQIAWKETIRTEGTETTVAQRKSETDTVIQKGCGSTVTANEPEKKYNEPRRVEVKKKEQEIMEDPHWKDYEEYIALTIAKVEEGSEAREVKMDPNFDVENVEELREKEKAKQTAKEYIGGFQIITKQEFEKKLGTIAEEITKLGEYSCIISEVGKSNFWVTGKVLEMVRLKGGRAPKNIISVPVQEKGVRKQKVKIPNLTDAGHIVFLDDGSYSGSQLVNLINMVIDNQKIAHSVGLVAMSDEAKKAIAHRKGQTKTGYLGQPIDIKKYDSKEELDQLYNTLELTLGSGHIGDETHPDGDHMVAFYYKIPDYASVRHRLLTQLKDEKGKTPTMGYTQGMGSPQKSGEGKMIIVRTGASEPYKGLVMKMQEKGFEMDKLGII
jgi:hypothetical protein